MKLVNFSIQRPVSISMFTVAVVIFGFVSFGPALVQFCPTVGIGAELAFPQGETRLTAIVKDDFGQPGLPASIIVRVTGE